MFLSSMLPEERERRVFEALYQAYHYTCVAAALTVTGDQALAEDAAHNTFLEMIRKKERYLSEGFLALPAGRIRSLLTLMTRHNAIDLLRAAGRYTELEEAEAVPAGEESDPAALVTDREGLRRLVEAIGALPEACRQVFELRYYHDMSYAEIADFLGISETNVSVRLSRGRRLLALLLQKEESNDKP